MDIITAIIVGLIAGWLAGVVMKGSGYGVLGNVLLGALGGVIGSWVFDFFGIAFYGIFGSIIVAAVGAIVLIYLIRLI